MSPTFLPLDYSSNDASLESERLLFLAISPEGTGEPTIDEINQRIKNDCRRGYRTLGLYSDGVGSPLCAVKFHIEKEELSISQLATRPDMKCRGFGRLLLLEVERQSVLEGATYSRLQSREESVGFYEKLGYFEINAVMHTMVKPLVDIGT